MDKKTTKQDVAPGESVPTSNKDASLIDQLESFEKRYAPLIQAKVRAGLTRDQAIGVIRSQIKEDPAIAEAQLKAAEGRS